MRYKPTNTMTSKMQTKHNEDCENEDNNFSYECDQILNNSGN